MNRMFGESDADAEKISVDTQAAIQNTVKHGWVPTDSNETEGTLTYFWTASLHGKYSTEVPKSLGNTTHFSFQAFKSSTSSKLVRNLISCWVFSPLLRQS